MKNVALSLCVLALGLALNIYNIDFPLGYHGDELKKVHFVKTGKRDFKHPTLMLELGMLVTGVARPEENRLLAVRCRLISAVSGALIALLLFWMAGRRTGSFPALAASSGLAVSPIMVVHAHYFKEDMLFTCMSVLTLWALWRYCRKQETVSALLLGLVAGFALSAQYKAVLLVLLILVVPLFAVEMEKKNYYAKLPIVFAVALFVFVTVNYQLFFDYHRFSWGLTYEMRHALTGHFIRMNPFSTFFGFHLIRSIGPGISWPFTILALSGLLLMLIRWKKLALLDRIFAVYGIMFYAAHEASPLKPFPDYCRYMIPVIPALFYFIAYLIRKAAQASHKVTLRFFLAAVFAGSFLWTVYDSFLLDRYFKKDTRITAQRMLAESGRKSFVEQYVLPSNTYDIKFLADMDFQKEKTRGVQLLAASSLNYDRFYFGKDVSERGKADGYRRRKQYDRLFSFPYQEIRPEHRTYAFSNPVIRLIDIGGY